VADNADVIQGRLGWESGDISEADPEALEPHRKNKEIYGDTDEASDLDETFRESVGEKGVLEPLVITDGKQIISGHRRWLAAKAAGLDSVPVRYSEFDSELAEREALVEFNRQREKTPGQIVNEFEEMLAVERERAKERKTEATGHREKFHEAESGRAKDKAAEKVNADVSGRTLEKGKKVKDKAESDDEPEEVREAAREAWEGLQNGDESFNSAYETVREAEQSDAGGKDSNSPDGHDLDVLTSQQTDEWSSPRELVEPIDDAVGGFDLDPCSGAERSPFASDTYSKDDDGLSKSWQGTVWVNPPYSEMDAWTEKAIREAERDGVDTVVYLCKGDSSTQWWHTAAEAAQTILAVEGRLSFGDGDNSAPFASHLFVFGQVPARLRDALHAHGVVLEPRRNQREQVIADD
jgi:phage N-6-adenine-methyltransferase